jgi:ABC-type glycerol-3-phosphate transport system substrate-binding protein
VRHITIAGSALASIPILAACGGSAAAPAPTAAAAPPKPTSAPAAATAPVTGAAPTAAPATTGDFNVWFNPNWNETTNAAVGNVFVKWGKEKGINATYQLNSGGPADKAKLTAALQAGQPPDIDQDAAGAYWWKLGELADVADVYNKFKDQNGGMMDVSRLGYTMPDKTIVGVTYAVDGWAVHHRKSLLQDANGGKFPPTWDEWNAIAPKLNKLPAVHAWGMSIGHEGDHVNNIMTIVWGYGGALCNDKGEPAINSPETVAAIKMIAHQYKDLKIIPSEGWAAPDTSYNNQLYQKKSAAMVINPTSIYGWLQVNDKELLADTALYAPPAGPKGSFSEAGTWAWAIMKKSKHVDQAKDAISYFMNMDNYGPVLSAVLGRWVPVYKNMLNTDFWQKGEFSEMAKIALAARTRAYPIGAATWRDDMEQRFVLSDMLHKVAVENMAAEEAVGWAQTECEASFKKLGI